MNLSYITRDFWAGAEETNHPRAFAEALVQRGHQVTVFSPKTGLRRGVHRGVEHGVNTYGIPAERRLPALYFLDKLIKRPAEERKLASDLWSLFRFLGAHRELDFHLVDDPYPLGFLMALASRHYPSRWMLSLHSHWGLDSIEYPYKKRRSRFVSACIREALRSATIVRANSFLATEQARKYAYEIRELEIVPVNLGYRPASSESEARQEKQTLWFAVRERFGFQESKLVVSACRLDPVKGLDVFLKAASFIRSRYGEDVRFAVAGKSRRIAGLGEYGDYLKRLASDLGMADKITFIGHFPNAHTPALFAGANVNVVSSHIDMLNMVVPEAGTVLTPSVVTRTSGISHWVEKHRAGIVVPANAPEPLAHAIMEILSDPDREQAMGRGAFRLTEDFTPDAVAEKIEQFLQSSLDP